MASEFEIAVMKELGDIKSAQATNHGEVMAVSARVTKVEDAQSWSEKKQWIHSVLVGGISAVGIAVKGLLHGK